MLKAEYPLAFTKDLKSCKWDSKNVWLRAAIDVVLRKSKKAVVLYDYKTGSNQSAAKHRSQLMLYALLYMLKHTNIEHVEVAAIYLDLKLDNFYTSYTRNDIDLYWPRYLGRLQAVTDCRTFEPNPNGFTCKWCQHKKINEQLGQTKPACEYACL
jgi:RecB family exonuclease